MWAFEALHPGAQGQLSAQQLRVPLGILATAGGGGEVGGGRKDSGESAREGVQPE